MVHKTEVFILNNRNGTLNWSAWLWRSLNAHLSKRQNYPSFKFPPLRRHSASHLHIKFEQIISIRIKNLDFQYKRNFVFYSTILCTAQRMLIHDFFFKRHARAGIVGLVQADSIWKTKSPRKTRNFW